MTGMAKYCHPCFCFVFLDLHNYSYILSQKQNMSEVADAFSVYRKTLIKFEPLSKNVLQFPMGTAHLQTLY